MAVVLAVIAIFGVGMAAFFIFLNRGSGEASKIGQALEEEKKRLSTLTYDQLENIVNTQAKTETSHDGVTFNRLLTIGKVERGDTKTMQVRITLQGIKNKSIEESATINKTKNA